MGLLAQIFADAHDNTPLHERDIIEIGPPEGIFFDDGGVPELYDSRAINFQHILETGKITICSGQKQICSSDQSIDWNSDDAFTQALHTIEENTLKRIEQSPFLQYLLNELDEWDRFYRLSWEREVSHIVSEEMAAIPGLNNYRTVSNKEKYPTVERRATRLNDLAIDIENARKADSDPTITFKPKVEHDCETMSIIEGIALQKIDNMLLPQNAPQGDFKIASNYFYAIGYFNQTPQDDDLGGHAFIISSATANIIEATKKEDPYKENIDPSATFEDFIKGKMITCKDESIYGSFNIDMGDIARARIDHGHITTRHIFGFVDPQWAHITEDANGAPIPPEIQALAELKTLITRLESNALNAMRNGLDPMPYDQHLDETREMFDLTLNTMVDSGQIYMLSKFIQENPVQIASTPTPDPASVPENTSANSIPENRSTAP